MIEEWRIYKTNKTDIEVSNFGNVRGIKWNEQPLNIHIKNGRRYLNGIPVFKLVDFVFNGPLPKGFVVHHIDENKLNDKLNNLKRMSKNEHVSFHMKGNQYTLGYVPSEETRKKISEKDKGNTNVKGRIWVTKDGKSKMIHPQQTEDFLNKGYEIGRNTKGRIPWNKINR